MTLQDAYTGLHLDDNWELSDALETYIIGFIDCAKSNVWKCVHSYFPFLFIPNLWALVPSRWDYPRSFLRVMPPSLTLCSLQGMEYVPNACTEQAVKHFTLHGSWATNGGDYPWNHLDSAWMKAAMNKLVYHVRDGGCLSELALETTAPLIDEEQGVAQPSIEDDGVESSMPDEEGWGPITVDEEKLFFDAEDDTDNPSPAAPPALFAVEAVPKTNKRTPQPVSGRNLDCIVVASSSKSPSAERATTRAEQPSYNPGSSSSPLSSVPSNLPSSGRSRSNNNRDITTNTIAHHETRSVTRAASMGTPTPEPSGTNYMYGTRSKKVASGRGCVAKKDADTGEEYHTWPFDRILDSRRDKTGDDIEYKVKWLHSKPTWQPAVDLQDNPEDIAEFHKHNPDKLGPPNWFLRSMRNGAAE